MSETEIRIARRIATYMLEISEQQVDINFFQGLGLALAVVFEECTRLPAGSRKPQELLEWARALSSEVPFPKVREG
jgi:hypothetical protein